jgi:hypothetical protein
MSATEAALSALIVGGHHRSVEVLATDPATGAILARHAADIWNSLEAVRTMKD